jgi:hypothetical protein
MNTARRRFAGGADAVFVALIALVVVIEITGGFRGEILGLRVSITSPWKVFAWAVLIVGLRHVAVPRPSLLSRLTLDETDVMTPRALADEAVGGARRGRQLAFVLAFFTVVTVWMLLAQILAPFSVPDLGDPLISIWRLAWVAHQLPRDPLHLFDANIFHPHVRTLAYSDAMLFPAAVGAPLLWLGVHQVLVYNFIFLGSIVSSGVTMFVLVRALTSRSDAALVAGILFAFCAFRFDHYSHLELQVTPWMPLGLFWFHRTLAMHRLRDGLLTGLAVALQGLSSLYYGIFFSTLLVCLTGVLLAVRYSDFRRALRPLLAGGLLAAALLLPITVPYWQNRSIVGERGEGEVRYYSAVPADYLVPNRQSIYWGPQVTNKLERDLFPGVVPVALAAVALAPPISALRFAYLIVLAFAVDASFGLNGAVYRFLYDYVGPFRGLRAPARFGLIVALALSVLAGFGVARLVRLVNRPILKRALVVGLAVAALVEARPVLSLEPLWRQPPGIYAALPGDRASVLAEFPFPGPDETFGHDLLFMYFSTFHWNRLVNGASGFFPDDYLAFRKVMHEFPSERALTAIRARGVEFVVVHGRFYGPSAYARVTADLDGRSSLRLVTAVPWEGSEVRLYRFERGANLMP